MTAPDLASATAEVSVERRWRAMGTDAHLIVVGVADTETEDAVTRVESVITERLEDLAERAVTRVGELEGMWSRFLPTSEISALNRTGWAVVSPETFALVDRAVLAWRRTGGRFDPTRLRALEHVGYDRSFDELAPVGGPPPHRIRRTHPDSQNRVVDAGAPVDSLPTGCAGIVLDRFTRTVVLPVDGNGPHDGRTVTFDPGGIGKGFAADLMVEELLAAGAAGALVNLGGDLRVEGKPPAGDSWVIEIGEQAWSPEPLAVVELERGAVATSTPLRRRWTSWRHESRAGAGSVSAHHLLDAFTGRPAVNGPAVVAAIAGEGWWAEAAATALAAGAVTGPGAGLTLDRVATAVVDPDGRIRLMGGFENYTRTAAFNAGPTNQGRTR